MQVTEITVSAGRTFNNPYESYSNFKPSLSLKATLDPGEEPTDVIKELQARAESLMEDHRRHILDSLKELEEMTRRQAEARSLEKTIRESQERLDRLRSAVAVELPQLESSDEDDDDGPIDDEEPPRYERGRY